ncbi:Aryl-alcohol dehydrogenase [NADP(+)] [Vanrija pseudolonga]|uniref:Aryl-alcohol dehydrogenase [NADP(+)] n=1 Tax=Vanrija pseudolonga TaxID=143232 RepID=A0AAF0YCD3_9TREE|nr:Aryl-alcohol dehydrogenase [NADP(+)] [Vanrija pseudolonga]
MATIPPPTKLGRYRVLSPRAGLRVSPIQLGAMSLGSHSDQLGKVSKEQAFALLDAYYAAGGNYIDTANSYQGGESEAIIGEWVTARGNRDDLVIATKFTSNYKNGNKDHPIQVNRAGNSLKSIVLSLENSLKRLQTSYVDVLYLHWWDWTTPIEEVVQGLNNLVKAGKVLYLGISDTPAWVVAKANQYARDHGLAQFVIYQGKWSVLSRDLERDLLPLAIHDGLAIAAWGAVGQGRFQRKADRGASKDGRSALPLTDKEVAASDALEAVADELGVASVTAVALAYIFAKYPYVYPIVGGRKVEQLHENIGALDIKLSQKQVRFLDGALPFDYGEPTASFGLDPHFLGFQQHFAVESAGIVDYVPLRQPVDVGHLRESDKEAKKAYFEGKDRPW